MPARDAVPESVRTRIRPIFMTTTTTVLGLLPLVVFPGAGSELYRGLGSVVLGGLLVSTAFTLFLVPAVFTLMLDAREAIASRFGTRQELEIADIQPEPMPLATPSYEGRRHMPPQPR